MIGEGIDAVIVLLEMVAVAVDAVVVEEVEVVVDDLVVVAVEEEPLESERATAEH